MTGSSRHVLSDTSLTPTVIGGSEEQYSSKRFRETVETIPSPEEELQGRRPKPFVGPLAHEQADKIFSQYH